MNRIIYVVYQTVGNHLPALTWQQQVPSGSADLCWLSLANTTVVAPQSPIEFQGCAKCALPVHLLLSLGFPATERPQFAQALLQIST